jgi:hypothetical protein
MLAGALSLCPMLSFLDLHGNQIAAEGKLILRAAWCGEPLNLLLGEAGAGELRPFMRRRSRGRWMTRKRGIGRRKRRWKWRRKRTERERKKRDRHGLQSK